MVQVFIFVLLMPVKLLFIILVYEIVTVMYVCVPVEERDHYVRVLSAFCES